IGVVFMYFQEANKLEFINYIGKSYFGSCRNVFKKSKSLEERFNKDLSQFDLPEIAILFKELNSLSKQSIDKRKFIIKHYINYFLEKRPDKINPFELESNKWHEQFINHEGRKLISESDFNKLVSTFANKQDAVICQLCYEGICGARYSEIRNLKKTDIDWSKKTLLLKDDAKGERVVNVSEICINILKGAIEEVEYKSKNGSNKSKMGRTSQPLADNDYVVRGSIHKLKNDKERIAYQAILRRIENLKPHSPKFNITTKTLRYSGMMQSAINLSKRTGTSIKDFVNEIHWAEVAEQFNIKPYHDANGYVFYHGLTNHLSYEIINEFYNEIEDEEDINFKLVKEENITKEEVQRKKRITPNIFKELILSTYERCAISGETTRAVLEACHIQKYINKESDHVQNGILLRKDIHTLYDNCLITIDENYIVHVSEELESDHYQLFNNKKLYLPNNEYDYPSKIALRYHNSMPVNGKSQDRKVENLRS
ncbi:HNH endonuclease, partial [Priestia megaterium]|uniref:phage lytic cycle repressor MrpR family protein n=1 Tax=Priestia megaterium TaxID=1404 RepID=UPI003D01DC8E